MAVGDVLLWPTTDLDDLRKAHREARELLNALRATWIYKRSRQPGQMRILRLS